MMIIKQKNNKFKYLKKNKIKIFHNLIINNIKY